MRTSLIAFALLVACGGKTPAETTPPRGEGPTSPPAAVEPAPPAPDPRGAEIAPGAQRVEIVTEDGVILVATLWNPPGATRTAIFVHQLGSDRYEWAPVIADLVKPVELPDGDTEPPPARVLAIDMRGHGESTRTTSAASLAYRDFDDAAWAKLPVDVAAAVSYMRGLAPDARIGLVGSSIGSSAVILYAATDPEIPDLVLLSPGLDYHGLDILPAFTKWYQKQAFGTLIIAAAGDAAAAKGAAALAAVEPAEPEGYRNVRVIEGKRHGVAMFTDDEGLIAEIQEVFTAAD